MNITRVLHDISSPPAEEEKDEENITRLILKRREARRLQTLGTRKIEGMVEKINDKTKQMRMIMIMKDSS